MGSSRVFYLVNVCQKWRCEFLAFVHIGNPQHLTQKQSQCCEYALLRTFWGPKMHLRILFCCALQHHRGHCHHRPVKRSRLVGDERARFQLLSGSRHLASRKSDVYAKLQNCSIVPCSETKLRISCFQAINGCYICVKQLCLEILHLMMKYPQIDQELPAQLAELEQVGINS